MGAIVKLFICVVLVGFTCVCTHSYIIIVLLSSDKLSALYSHTSKWLQFLGNNFKNKRRIKFNGDIALKKSECYIGPFFYKL